MFCSQCGNRVPDGSRFCGLCGTKISVDLEMPAVQRAQQYMGDYVSESSFDWSGVKEEPHKKYAKDVVSPWGSTGLAEERVTVGEELQQRSRTMSFIDILKKEREEKALEEEIKAARIEEEKRAQMAQMQKPAIHIPPVYDDVYSPVITPFDAPLYTIAEEQQYPAPRETRPEMTIPPAGVDRSNTQPVEYFSEPGDRYQQALQPKTDPSIDYAESNKAKLVAELSSILKTDSSEQEKRATESFVNRYTDNKDLADIYLSIDPEKVPRVSNSRLHVPPMYDESQFAPTQEQPVAAVAQTPVYEQPAPQAPVQKPVYEQPATEAVASSTTAEIELLKARLAELMGATMTAQVEMPAPEIEDSIVETSVEETVPPQAEPTPEPEPQVVIEPAPQAEPVQEQEPELEPVPEPQVVSEPVPQVEPVQEQEPVQEVSEELAFLNYKSEAEEELPLIDPTPEVEEELPLINEQLEKAIAEAEENNEESTTDAMSVHELEKDLFGETTEEDIQAEETKKIDKFYTLYKKNEEFQKLLDEEYNKLKNENEEVPTVSAILGDDSDKIEADKKSNKSKDKANSKPEKTTQSKAVEPSVSDDEDMELSKGGTALTVIAVLIAILLVVLLAVILVLNFAPDSAIALQIDSIIETITSYFSGVEVPGRLLL